MWDNALNHAVLHWLNQYAQSSAGFNQFVSYLSVAPLFKGLPIVTLLWFYWFRNDDETQDTRRTVIATLIGTFLALLIARIANNAVPFQPRPFANPELALVPLAGVDEFSEAFDWNCFPSDHAALFFGLAAGIFGISRPAGYFIFLYVFCVVALPRIYLGFHYPTDILGGAILGIGCVALATDKTVRRLYVERCMQLFDRYPAGFQTVLFVFSFEIILMFADVRRLMNEVSRYLPLVLFQN